MIQLVKTHIDDLKQLCKKYAVQELYLFGSAAKDDFNEQLSDLDFVVRFSDKLEPVDFADHYFSLLEDLSKLFGKKIDLLSYRALKNEVIIREIEQTKVPLYAA